MLEYIKIFHAKWPEVLEMLQIQDLQHTETQQNDMLSPYNILLSLVLVGPWHGHIYKNILIYHKIPHIWKFMYY